MDNTERQDITRRILAVLNHEKRRCTYGALADLLGIANQDVGRYLGCHRPDASWVVLKATGQPSRDWAPDQLAEGLCDGPEPISCPKDLKRLVSKYEGRADTMNDPHAYILNTALFVIWNALIGLRRKQRSSRKRISAARW